MIPIHNVDFCTRTVSLDCDTENVNATVIIIGVSKGYMTAVHSYTAATHENYTGKSDRVTYILHLHLE